MSDETKQDFGAGPVVIRAQFQPWMRGIELVAFNNTQVAQLTWHKQEPAIAAPALMALRHEQAQTLMDDLWACGVRPTEGEGSAGALAATERHLQDLQRLVFKEKREVRK